MHCTFCPVGLFGVNAEVGAVPGPMCALPPGTQLPVPACPEPASLPWFPSTSRANVSLPLWESHARAGCIQSSPEGSGPVGRVLLASSPGQGEGPVALTLVEWVPTLNFTAQTWKGACSLPHPLCPLQPALIPPLPLPCPTSRPVPIPPPAPSCPVPPSLPWSLSPELLFLPGPVWQSCPRPVCRGLCAMGERVRCVGSRASASPSPARVRLPPGTSCPALQWV